MPLHVFVRFEPAPGKDHLLETELRGILTPTRAEPGCLRVE
ncbi:MAG TPA: antibiotic biosynthesis monooxygenase, partial [Solibacterales bacterium]|nr:antibiotic biosynthesis monooxygenase [Bryobacterales bacterium]